MPHPYATAIVILAIIWIFCFESRKDMRKAMVWSGLACVLILSLTYLALKFVDTQLIDLGETMLAGYWNPYTLFNANSAGTGISIIDILFMFFTGGIAAFLYEYTFGQRFVQTRSRKHHARALIVGLLGAILTGALLKPHPIYLVIAFCIFGAASIWIERHDLIPHSFWGAAVFTTLYIALFAMFLQLVPDMAAIQYKLASFSGQLILGVPLEHILYAASFGLLWAPLYEYEHGLRLRS